MICTEHNMNNEFTPKQDIDVSTAVQPVSALHLYPSTVKIKNRFLYIDTSLCLRRNCFIFYFLNPVVLSVSSSTELYL